MYYGLQPEIKLSYLIIPYLNTNKSQTRISSECQFSKVIKICHSCHT